MYCCLVFNMPISSMCKLKELAQQCPLNYLVSIGLSMACNQISSIQIFIGEKLPRNSVVKTMMLN